MYTIRIKSIYTRHIHTHTMSTLHTLYLYILTYTTPYTIQTFYYTLTTHSIPRTRQAHAPTVHIVGKVLAVPRKRGRNRCSLGNRDLLYICIVYTCMIVCIYCVLYKQRSEGKESVKYSVYMRYIYSV